MPQSMAATFMARRYHRLRSPSGWQRLSGRSNALAWGAENPPSTALRHWGRIPLGRFSTASRLGRAGPESAGGWLGLCYCCRPRPHHGSEGATGCECC